MYNVDVIPFIGIWDTQWSLVALGVITSQQWFPPCTRQKHIVYTPCRIIYPLHVIPIPLQDRPPPPPINTNYHCVKTWNHCVIQFTSKHRNITPCLSGVYIVYWIIYYHCVKTWNHRVIQFTSKTSQYNPMFIRGFNYIFDNLYNLWVLRHSWSS